jgi:hypothetical protein
VKHTTLHRSTPLRTRRPMRKRRATSRRQTRVRDEAYLAWLRTLPCCCPQLPVHPGGDPHHPKHRPEGGGVGAGLKADDHRAVPLSREHHTDIDALSGPFKGWTRDQVHAFLDSTAAWLREVYLGQPQEPNVDMHF